MDAEARSVYFADLLNRESRLKRFITGASFVLSSAIVVSFLAKHPYISTWLALLIAIAQGYVIAVSQDAKIRSLEHLHIEWLRLSNDYDRLWSHTEDTDSESRLRRYQDREIDLSASAASEVAHNERLWQKWIDIVHKKYETT